MRILLRERECKKIEKVNDRIYLWVVESNLIFVLLFIGLAKNFVWVVP